MPSSMQSACGLSGQNLSSGLWESSQSMHSDPTDQHAAVHKQASNPLVFAQVYQFLYTVFLHSYTIFTSVIEQFVHIIHIAYIKNDKLKKGTI